MDGSYTKILSNRGIIEFKSTVKEYNYKFTNLPIDIFSNRNELP
jgi:hypothetical protein